MTRHDLGRDGFHESMHGNGERNTAAASSTQLHRSWVLPQTGTENVSPWTKAALTAVVEVFVKLYEKGWIYKGCRIINWCPVCQTSLSDAEVEHVDQDGFFWHINYPVVGEAGTFRRDRYHPSGDTAG